MDLTIIDHNGQENSINLDQLTTRLKDQANLAGEKDFQPQTIIEKTQKYLQIFQMGAQKKLSSAQLSELLASICREEGFTKLAAQLQKENQNNMSLNSSATNLPFSKSIQERMKKIYLPHTQDLSIDSLIKKISSPNCPLELAAKIENMISRNRFLPHPNILKTKRPFSHQEVHLQDSLSDIFDQLKQAAINFQNLISTSINFSTLRPKMSLIKSTLGYSSGPVSFVKIYTSTFEALRQNLSADFTPLQTFILNIHHPDILEFLIFIKNFQKNSLNRHLEFLIELTPAFLDALDKEEDFELINPENGQPINLLSAKNTFDLIISTILENPTLGLDLPHSSISPNQILISGLVNLAAYDNPKTFTAELLQDLGNIEKFLNHQKAQVTAFTKLPTQSKIAFTGWNDLLISQNLAYGSVASLELAEKLFAEIRQSVDADTQLEIDLHSPLLNLLDSTRGIECLDQLATQRTNLDGQEIYQLHPALREQLTALGLANLELTKQIFESNSLADFYQIPVPVKNLFKTAKEISPDFHLELSRLLEKQLNGPVEKKIYFGSSLELDKIKATILHEIQLGIRHIRLCQFDQPGKAPEAHEIISSDRNFLHNGKTKKRRHREIQPPLFQIKKTEEISIPPLSK